MKRMNKIAAILMVSVMAMAVLIPTVSAVGLTVQSTTGVKDETGTYLLGNGLSGSDFVQIIRVNGGIDPPDPSDPNYVGGDDEYLEMTYTGSIFDTDNGQFYWSLTKIVDGGDVIMCRAWNGPSIDEATYYGDSHTYTVPGGPGPFAHDYGTWWTNDTKPAGTKSVPMELGWNGISLCYEPSSNTTANVLSSIAGNYSAVKEWDPILDDWADAATMDRGTGYFVYVITACTWEHTGQKKTAPMEIPLETGLNFVGYPFDKTNSTSDALAGLNYYYAAPFDASTQKYEDTYNPAAPAPFNDFTTISPCEAFWVSSKDGVDWTAA